jgi:uncharacterized membrane protein YbhN (UPF0104 family)
MARDGQQQDDFLGFDRRKAIITGIAAAILAIGAVALLGQVAHYHRLLDALEEANRVWFPLCILGEVIAYTGYILAYRDLARVDGGPVLGYWQVTRIVGLGFGAYIVGASAGGLAVDYWALHRAGAGTHEAGRRVLALNTLEWLILATFAALSAIAVLAGAGNQVPLGMSLGWLTALPLALAGALYVSSPKRIDRLSSLPAGEEPKEKGRDLGAWARWAAVKIRKGFADAVGSLHYLRFVLFHPLRYPAGVFGFAVYWLGDILTMYAALRAFDVRIGLADLVIAYTTGYVITSAPLPAGASGASEATTAFALHAVGVPLAQALLAVFTYRFFTFWLPILPALGLVPAVRKLAVELPSARREEPFREAA